mmetsp:Transcript_125048/g.176501  ORF Transcript_125048/g.176501 Transcript_125048/m.176501 type:complete len:87 (-) Transcript_125048:464-724(-)
MRKRLDHQACQMEREAICEESLSYEGNQKRRRPAILVDLKGELSLNFEALEESLGTCKIRDEDTSVSPRVIGDSCSIRDVTAHSSI